LVFPDKEVPISIAFIIDSISKVLKHNQLLDWRGRWDDVGTFLAKF
jgi:hypothetical protein